MTDAPSHILDPAGGEGHRSGRFVQESRFGVWFLGTDIWANHVLKRAIEDLDHLISNRRPSYPVIADFGCGFGRSFEMLNDRFRPDRIIGIDFDREMLARSRQEAERHGLTIDLRKVSSSSLPLADQAVDMVFCHQTLHHVIDQREVLREFHRVLKHDGLLLFAESTRKYIHSWIIRLLFCHPLDNQWSAPEYLGMIRDAGFKICQGSVSYPYLWWSRSDFGLLENLFRVKPPLNREETLVNLVAIRE